MTDSALLDWANKQPDWVKDALRRHTEFFGAELSDEAKAAIRERVEHHAGKAFETPPACDPIIDKHIVGMASASANRTVLCSIGPVKHLNRLAEGQKLAFAVSGLTLIYGDNGSGKSGYARITKQLCRSLSKDKLLGNVFSDVVQPPPEALVRFRLDGVETVTELPWKAGEEPPIEIANISVFDSQNAALYVRGDNEIGFLPSDIALLQRHSEHRIEMGNAFEQESKVVQAALKVPLAGGYTLNGPIALMLAKLEAKTATLPTEAEIKAVGNWTPADETELANLMKELGADPAVLARQRRRVKAALTPLDSAITAIGTTLSVEAAEKYKALLQDEASTKEAASLAADAKFATLPLKDVGQAPWRHMYDYARLYAESLGMPPGKLPDNVGDLCVTCHTPLDDEAAARIKSFNDFVADTATKAAEAAEAARLVAMKVIQDLVIPTKAQVEAALSEYRATGATEEANAGVLAGYLTSATERKTGLLKSTAADAVDGVAMLADDPARMLKAIIDGLEADAVAFDDAAAKDTARAAIREKYQSLSDKKKLSENMPAVLDRLAKLEQLKHLKACKTAVGTGDVSTQITTLRRATVMDGLESRIEAELKAFGLDHIPLEVKDRSDGGQSMFGVNFSGAVKATKSDVLSEGEQRALALACFLGEVGGDNANNGLIIDDPVSSLDHIRMRAVANRLVEEAKKRQVIILTHNILFYNEMWDAAARANPQVPVLSNFLSKSTEAGFGLISQTDEPWLMAKVSRRIQVLRDRLATFDGITDFDTEAWRARSKDFYTDLREAWERLVEEQILGKVIQRYSAEVQTMRLKLVVMTDNDYKIVFHAMKRVSERSGHDQPAGKPIAFASPKEMKADLGEIETYSGSLKKRAKEAENDREKLEEPPAAVTA